jgi:hypothetical protein
METKNNVEFKRTPFYAENLGEGKFAAPVYTPRKMKCSQCGNISYFPEEKGCRLSADGLHKWEKADFRSRLIKHLPIPKKWKKVIELLDIDIVP